MTAIETSLLQAALRYAEYGLPIHPLHHTDENGRCSCGKVDCDSAGKHPRTRHGFKDATTDPDQIKEWWEKWPSANIGIATGEVSNLFVIDVDNKAGKNGFESIKEARLPMGDTPIVATPNYGQHYWYQYLKGGEFSCSLSGVDIKGDGGYVVAPPSRINGRAYTFVKEGDYPPIPSEWVRFLNKTHHRDVQGLTEVDSGLTDQQVLDKASNRKFDKLWRGNCHDYGGDRSKAIHALIGFLANATPSNDQVRRLFRNSGLAGDPQKPERDGDRYINYSLQKFRAELAELAKVNINLQPPPMPDQTPPPPRELIVVNAADVQVRKVDWYWPNVFPTGAISLLAGTAGTNKTTLGADIAGRGSVGLPWPDGSGHAPPGKVMFISGEDDASTTIVPRLMAAQADLQNIDIVEGVRVAGRRRTFQLTDFIDLLEQRLESDAVRLVLLDPLSAFVGSTETHNDAQVRALLEPLRYLAETRGVAVIGIMHPPKMRYKELVSRISGSAAFGNAARAVWYVQADPNISERRYFLPAKLNLASDEFGFAYRRGQREVAGIGPQLCIEWEPQQVRKADVLEQIDAKEDKSARSRIKNLIRDCWDQGMTRATDIQEEAELQGINMAPTTLTAAKKELGVRTVTVGFQGRSHWLPKEPVPRWELAVNGEPPPKM
jgi:hypothetical protein